MSGALKPLEVGDAVDPRLPVSAVQLGAAEGALATNLTTAAEEPVVLVSHR